MLNLATMHGLVVKEIASKRSLRESMDRIIAACAKGHPHNDWERLRGLSYDDLDEPRESEPSVLLRSSPSLGVAVGFDSGDFVSVAKLPKAGLVAVW